MLPCQVVVCFSSEKGKRACHFASRIALLGCRRGRRRRWASRRGRWQIRRDGARRHIWEPHVSRLTPKVTPWFRGGGLVRDDLLGHPPSWFLHSPFFNFQLTPSQFLESPYLISPVTYPQSNINIRGFVVHTLPHSLIHLSWFCFSSGVAFWFTYPWFQRHRHMISQPPMMTFNCRRHDC